MYILQPTAFNFGVTKGVGWVEQVAYPLVQQPAILVKSPSRMTYWLRFRIIVWRCPLQTSAGTPAKLRIFIIHATPRQISGKDPD